MNGGDILADMAETYRERGKLYKDNYLRMGPVMTALFPEGVVLRSEQDFIKWHLLDWAVGKITRFASTGMTHIDSIHDAAVYLAMLEAELKNEANENVNKERGK